MVPIVPLLVIVPLGSPGIPLAYTALIPVPLMCLLLGWSLHNDTAYDSTAVWLHVVSGVRGASDRVGPTRARAHRRRARDRLGSAVTVFVLDDWRLLPSLVGVSTALLLGGLGVGSITSARFPYPAVKPGDSPFQQPQSTGAVTALVQSITMFGSLLVAAPAIWFAGLGLLERPVVARGRVRRGRRARARWCSPLGILAGRSRVRPARARDRRRGAARLSGARARRHPPTGRHRGIRA